MADLRPMVSRLSRVGGCLRSRSCWKSGFYREVVDEFTLPAEGKHGRYGGDLNGLPQQSETALTLINVPMAQAVVTSHRNWTGPRSEGES